MTQILGFSLVHDAIMRCIHSKGTFLNMGIKESP